METTRNFRVVFDKTVEAASEDAAAELVAAEHAASLVEPAE